MSPPVGAVLRATVGKYNIYEDNGRFVILGPILDGRIGQLARTDTLEDAVARAENYGKPAPVTIQRDRPRRATW